MNIVIIGHVDHGKSTLIGRLLYDTNSIPESLVDDVRAISAELGKEMEFSYLLDSLEEEREQNITIDTTQTFFSSAKRDYVIIDAPGHREFLKNMITGASMAEAAVLIVDTNLGIEEQTQRHAYIASLLGLKNIIVVFNKMDSVDFKQQAFEKAKQEISTFLDQLKITPLHTIPIAARHGDNISNRSEKMPWYNGPTLVEALDGLTPVSQVDQGFFRLPVQDRYSVENKEILVGRIEAGTIRAGDEVIALPSNLRCKVKSLEAWNSSKTQAEAGESVGMTLDSPKLFERGEILCAGRDPKLTQEFEATVFWMSPKALSTSEVITLKCATQEIPCKVTRIITKVNSSSLEVIGKDCSDIGETEVAQVVVHAERPVVIESFSQVESLGRFVLVRADEIDGGGIISDIQFSIKTSR